MITEIKKEDEQLKIRPLTMRRLRFVKPHIDGASLKDLASDAIDKHLAAIVRQKRIALPPDCEFSVTK